MLAVKNRRPSEYVPRFAPMVVAIAADTAVAATASPARALQAELAERLAQGQLVSVAVPGRSIRWRAAMICAATLASWVPIAAAGWVLLA